MTVANAVIHEADFIVVEPHQHQHDYEQQESNSRGARVVPDCPPVPEWVSQHQAKGTWGAVLQVDEWAEEEDAKGGMSVHSYRQKHGWQGRDLIHDVHSPVRILEYYVQYGTSQPLTGLSRGGIGTKLTGIVHFTRRAESHQGYCHGGSMTSVMDDVIGWVAFLVTGQCRPWSGYTVQVNTSLKRPIPVDSILVVQATIVQVLRRKVSVEATIFDPSEEDDLDYDGGDDDGIFKTINPNTIHAASEGLVVINRGILPVDYDRSSTMSTASSSMSETNF